MTRVLARAGLALALAVSAGACTHTVVAPESPEMPVSAFLLDHGKHASLVLERADGLTRYSYGHWDYYARNRTGPLRASGTLFGDNAAGVGRRPVAGPAELGAVKRNVLVHVQAAWRLDVPGARAAALGRRFDRIFRQGAATRIHNPLYDLEFVRHPSPYHWRHNSNHVTGEWLRALGCEVELRGPFSQWRVIDPAAAP